MILLCRLHNLPQFAQFYRAHAEGHVKYSEGWLLKSICHVVFLWMYLCAHNTDPLQYKWKGAIIKEASKEKHSPILKSAESSPSTEYILHICLSKHESMESNGHNLLLIIIILFLML